MPFKNGKENVFYKHGLSQTRFYIIYKAMMRRCYDKNSNYYHRYGKRNIKVCKKWHNFINFASDMRESYLKNFKEHGSINTTLDRIDNNKGYNCSNCKWSTAKEQSNNSNNCHYLRHEGKRQSMMAWANELNMSYNTLRNRINNLKWSTKKALTTKPVKGRNQHT